MPNSDLISRAAIIREIERIRKSTKTLTGIDFLRMIETFPAVDAAPVVHGRWEEKMEHMGLVCCSVCHDCYVEKEWIFNKKWAWCPQCGARMDGGDDDA